MAKSIKIRRNIPDITKFRKYVTIKLIKNKKIPQLMSKTLANSNKF